MTILEIEKMVASFIDQSMAGLNKEHPKFDFKKSWYDLTSNQSKNEFIKDTSAMANTFGLDGFIVIGFDDKTKEFNQSVFTDSKLRDPSEVLGLINKKVEPLFELITFDSQILGNKISIIHIPPSINKPHVIRQYQSFEKDGSIKKQEEHKIFVRKNSETFPSTKYDLDLMYYDRKNIIPDYELHSFFNPIYSTYNRTLENKLWVGIKATIENTGRRPVAISQIYLTIEFLNLKESGEINLATVDLLGSNLIIKSNEIWNDRLDLYTSEFGAHNPIDMNAKISYFNQEKVNIRNSSLEIILANGVKVISDLRVVR